MDMDKKQHPGLHIFSRCFFLNFHGFKWTYFFKRVFWGGDLSTFWSSQEIIFLFKQIFKTTISTPNLFFLFPKEFNLSYPTESSFFFSLSLSFSSYSHVYKYLCPLYRNYPYNLAMLWSLILKITSDLGISSELDHFKYHRYLNKGY